MPVGGRNSSVGLVFLASCRSPETPPRVAGQASIVVFIRTRRIEAMAGRKLKVFRTAVGFHDAYVAAPSRKVALAAWGAAKDLFAIGSAEEVTDPALTQEALARPGEVIKRSRGDLSAQLAALPKSARAGPAIGLDNDRVGRTKPKPQPSRTMLDRAEATLRAFQETSEAEISALKTREEEIRREREALERRVSTKAANLRARVARTRKNYEVAMEDWRGSI